MSLLILTTLALFLLFPNHAAELAIFLLLALAILCALLLAARLGRDDEARRRERLGLEGQVVERRA